MQEPKRQGYYAVTLGGPGSPQERSPPPFIATWRELDKETGKRWYRIVSDATDPTKEKTYEPLEGVQTFKPATASQIALATEVEPTEAQHIARSVAAHNAIQRLWKRTTFSIPENRMLQVGQLVEYGALVNAKVVAVHEDGQLVTLEYTHTPGSRQLANAPNVQAYITASWLDVYAKDSIQQTKLYDCPVYTRVQPHNTALGALVTRMWEQGIKDNPDYQRGYVWSPADEQKFLDSVFSGKNLGSFVFLRNPYPVKEEVFDGKQRLTTMLRLVTGQIAYKDVYWHQMSPRDRYEVENRNVACLILNSEQFTRADLLQMFLDINSAGVPQTEEHLQHVRQLLAAETKPG